MGSCLRGPKVAGFPSNRGEGAGWAPARRSVGICLLIREYLTSDRAAIALATRRTHATPRWSPRSHPEEGTLVASTNVRFLRCSVVGRPSAWLSLFQGLREGSPCIGVLGFEWEPKPTARVARRFALFISPVPVLPFFSLCYPHTLFQEPSSLLRWLPPASSPSRFVALRTAPPLAQERRH